VFGKTTDGQHVVDEIARTATDAADRPREDVVIHSVEITEA
jgi:cyclophilin family peptidyl-prolyl cis-trans isomerase